MSSLLWQTKLHARLHDPAEKALILMRTAEGHEGGTSHTLLHALLSDAERAQTRDWVKKADWWASAADRAAFPNHDADGKWPVWQSVRFDQRPVLIHPLTGEAFDLKKLDTLEPEQIKAASLNHFKTLIQKDDPKKTLLAFWRFGPELRGSELGALWQMTPADTRVPDHTIWDHLDLTSAFAGAFADGEEPALLAVSLGPVQSFIASARSTSDLWAGSHLLSRLAWEAMRVVCEEFGPDAILFPRLRGVPQVDLWLRDGCGLPAKLFADCNWTKSQTDTNPLFSAALPNRFTALVPESRVREIAEKLTQTVQQWACERAEDGLKLLLEAAGVKDSSDLPAYAQIHEQLAGFPEVHWAAVPWSLAASGTELKVYASDEKLAAAMRPFFNADKPGFLDSKAWELLGGELKLDEGSFWKANPGVMYPALHELLERVLAATKSTRDFAQMREQGWRDSLTGEAEWLTTDREQLKLPPGQRKDTLWAKVAQQRKAWVKKGEHLGALSTLKRLWPTLFANELKGLIGDAQRFVVSTHTMALAGPLAQWFNGDTAIPEDIAAELSKINDRVALPPLLAHNTVGDDLRRALARKIPVWLEAAREAEDERETRRVESKLGNLFGAKPESYYALILMDGDHMGAWLAAADAQAKTYEESFHPQIREALGNRFSGDPKFLSYAKAKRAPNPAWHMAISDALNQFSLTLAPTVLHQHFNGRVIYAGGDDLMAMLPVVDLLPAMAALRAAYSGIDPVKVGAHSNDTGFTRQDSGFVRSGRQVLRVMGEKATASIGAVIAHHKTPLNLVLSELRNAERRAKTEGGRDAFSITVLKRSGGAQRLTEKWMRKDGDSPMTCLRELSDALYHDEARRTAYNARQWMADLPSPEQMEPEQWQRMVTQLLAAQFKRQKLGGKNASIHALRLSSLALDLNARSARHETNLKGQAGALHPALDHIIQFLSVAEFLAREGRAAGGEA